MLTKESMLSIIQMIVDSYLLRNNHSNLLLSKYFCFLKLSAYMKLLCLLKQMMHHFSSLSGQYTCLISSIICSLINNYVHIYTYFIQQTHTQYYDGELKLSSWRIQKHVQMIHLIQNKNKTNKRV